MKTRRPLTHAAAFAFVAIVATASAIEIRLDYTYDTTNFFGAGNPAGAAAGAQARQGARAAANYYESILRDNLDSIRPSGSNGWTARFRHPSKGGFVEIRNLKVSGNTIIIYMGSEFTAGRLSASGGPGSVTNLSGSRDWQLRVVNRGQSSTQGSSATDVAPWGGAIAFKRAGSEYWNFNLGQQAGGTQADFYSSMIAQIGLIVGIGTSDSWQGQISGNRFRGEAAQRVFGGGVPVQGRLFAPGIAAVVPGHGRRQSVVGDSDWWGYREVLTNLDLAALRDIGWTVRTRVDPRSLPFPDNGLGLSPAIHAGIVRTGNSRNRSLRNGRSGSNPAILLVDTFAIDSATFTGVPMALALHDQVRHASQVATRNLNNRLSRLRAGLDVETIDPTPFHSEKNPLDPISEPIRGWNVFTAGDFAAFEHDPLGDLRTGYEADIRTGSVGLERRVGDNLAFGLAWSYLDHHARLGGRGEIELTGHTLATYATWRRGALYADLLYAWTGLDADTARHTGLGATATGETDAASHSLDLNLGYNLENGPLVMGPIAGLSYQTGDTDPFTELGGGVAALSYAGAEFDSLVSRLGWQISHHGQCPAGRTLILQTHASWTHEFLSDPELVSVQLLHSPYAGLNPDGIRPLGGYEATARTPDVETDWLSLGAGLILLLGENSELSLDYETRLFLDALTVHYGGLRYRRKF